MYVSPKLTTFGTLREITLSGNTGPFDTVGNRDGCNNPRNVPGYGRCS